MITININGEDLDLYGNDVIAGTFAIARIGDISKRSGSYTTSYSLPLTAHNKRVIDNAQLLNSNSSLPYSNLPCFIEEGGLRVFDGVAVIEGIQDSIELYIKAGNSTFFDIVKERNLSDLDLSEYDHEFYITDIVASRTNTEGYIYPIIEYQADNPSAGTRVINCKHMAPAAFLHTLIKEIITQAGYTYEGALFADVDFVNVLLPGFDEAQTDNNLPINEFEANRASDFILYSITTANYGATTRIAPLNIETFDNNNNYDTSTFKYTCQHPGVYNFSFSLDLEWRVSVNTTTDLTQSEYDVLLIRKRNGIETILSTTSFNIVGTSTLLWSASTPLVHNFSATLTEETLELNDEIFIRIATVEQGASFVSGATSIEVYFTEATLTNECLSVLNYTNPLHVVDNLPRFKQYDLLRTVAQMWGQLIQVDENNMKVVFKAFNDIPKAINQAVNWSSKIDYSRLHKLEFRLDSYAQSNNLKYQDDDNITKPTGTDWVMPVADLSLQKDKDLIVIPFAATETVESFFGLNVPYIGVFTDGSASATKPRLVKLKLYNLTMQWADDYGNSDTETTNIPIPYFIDAGETFNLGFDNSLKSNYTALQAVLNKTKIITERIRLTPVDILNLDFFKPVYLERTGEHGYNGYFYISEITQYKFGLNESTEVQLVRL